MKRTFSLGVLAVAFAIGLSAAPAVAAQGDLTGTWTSIDGDGSNQTLTITGSGIRSYALFLVDDEATLCDTDPARATGSARVEGNELFMRAAVTCVPGGNHLRGVIEIGFTYDGGDDTLTDSFGIVWSRA